MGVVASLEVSCTRLGRRSGVSSCSWKQQQPQQPRLPPLAARDVSTTVLSVAHGRFLQWCEQLLPGNLLKTGHAWIMTLAVRRECVLSQASRRCSAALAVGAPSLSLICRCLAAVWPPLLLLLRQFVLLVAVAQELLIVAASCPSTLDFQFCNDRGRYRRFALGTRLLSAMTVRALKDRCQRG